MDADPLFKVTLAYVNDIGELLPSGPLTRYMPSATPYVLTVERDGVEVLKFEGTSVTVAAPGFDAMRELVGRANADAYREQALTDEVTPS